MLIDLLTTPESDESAQACASVCYQVPNKAKSPTCLCIEIDTSTLVIVVVSMSAFGNPSQDSIVPLVSALMSLPSHEMMQCDDTVTLTSAIAKNLCM
jgi:hypothetical protein